MVTAVKHLYDDAKYMRSCSGVGWDEATHRIVAPRLVWLEIMENNRRGRAIKNLLPDDHKKQVDKDEWVS